MLGEPQKKTGQNSKLMMGLTFITQDAHMTKTLTALALLVSEIQDKIKKKRQNLA